MKKSVNTLAFVLFAAALLSEPLMGQAYRDITLKVVNEDAKPISGASASISFLQGRDRDRHEGRTNGDGKYSASGMSIVGVRVSATAENHYAASLHHSPDFKKPRGEDEITLVLPTIKTPVPLLSSRVHYLQFPVQNEWLGYDFAAGDWVAPHGKGEETDIRFRFQAKFTGYAGSGEKLERALEISKTLAQRAGKEFSEEEFKKSAGHWEGTLELSFPGEKEGLIEVTDRYWPHSELKLPHQAPETGYLPTRRYAAHTRGPRLDDPEVGYFLRTRVKLDAAGEIVSAHYAKIYGDFRFDPRGAVSFTYYFNPTPNDRNLEFDPMHNLFPKDRDGTNNLSP